MRNGERGRKARLSSVLFERNLAVVLSEEIEEALVVPGLHVEQARDDFVVATCLFQAAAHNFAHIRTRDLTIHEERIHSGPERLMLLDHPLVEVIRHRATTLALGPEQDRVVRANLGRQVLKKLR